jgi:DNA-binding winged helix-turn-helix (wHTH) protein/Tol biopolymer transport system component
LSVPAKIRIGTWVATPALNLLEEGGRSIRLEPKAMDVLVYLAARAGQVVSVEELLRDVWRGVVVTDASVYMAIKQLRRALAGSRDETDYVETIPKRGYRLTVPVEHLAAQAETADGAAFAGPSTVGRQGRSVLSGRRYSWSTLAATAFAVALLGSISWLLSGAATDGDGAARPAGMQVFEFSVAGLQGMAVSPDGRHIAYVARTGQLMSNLYLRPLDSLQPLAVAGTEGALTAPFWSPDSRHIAYGAIEKPGRPQFLIGAPKLYMARVARDGGPPQTLAKDLPVGADGAWSADGIIVFDGGTGLERIAAATGADRAQVTHLEPGENAHAEPSFLPDGRRFLFTTAFGEPGVYVHDLDSGERMRVLVDSATAVYANGYLLFNRGRALMAQRFDVDRLALRGQPVRIADGLRTGRSGYNAAFSVSENGVLAYVPFDSQELAPPALVQSRLAWYDRSGQRLGTVGEPGPYRGVALSPDGKRIAVHRHEEPGGGDLWMLEEGRSTLMRFTDGPRHETSPVFSADGSRLAYSGGDHDLYQKPASGAGTEQRVNDALRFALPTGWTRDDAILVTHTQTTATDADVSAVLGGDDGAVLLEGTRHNELGGVLSPDGRWLAFASDETGVYEVYVVPYPERTRKVQVSTAGGEGPQWSEEGELFYYTPDGALWSAPLDTADTDNVLAAPRPLFRAELMIGDHFSEIGELPHVPYAVAADGERFLINERVDGADDTYRPITMPIVVVLNWTQALEQ